jgi:hypothetical protein
MGHTTAFRTVTRTGTVACLAAGLALLGGGAAGADPLPAPLPQPSAPQGAGDRTTALPLPSAPSGSGSTAPGLPALPGPLGDVTDQVTGALGGALPGGALPGGGGGTGAAGGGKTSGSGGSGGATGTSGSGKGTGAPSGSSSGATPDKGHTASGSTSGQQRSGARVSSEALTACIIPTGSGSPAIEFDLSVLGNDVGSPLAQAIPQVFTPCPKGAVPADDLVGADVDVEGLLGACVRITREVAPLQTTLVVLDHDVIKALTDAGLPLQQLVVPCPAGTPNPSPSTPAQTPGGASDPGTGRDQAASALPGLPDRLAFTGANAVPLATLALVLLGLGAELTRRARRLRRSASRG